MDEKEDPYNPLDKVNLGKSVAGAILRKEALPIDTLASFDGAGIYSIYYRGTFGPYSRLSEYNTNDFKAPLRPEQKAAQAGGKPRLPALREWAHGASSTHKLGWRQRPRGQS